MKGIKVLGLGAALILLVLSLLALGCKSEVETGDEIPIPNANFTQLDDSYNTGARYWNNKNRNGPTSDTEWDIRVDTTVKRGNSNSLRVSDNGYPTPWARTWVFVEEGGVKAGATYILSAYVRTSGSAKGRVLAQYWTKDPSVTKDQIFRTPQRVDLGTEYLFLNFTEGVKDDGNWVKDELMFTVPSNAAYVEICPYNEGEGTVWYTDFELKEVK